MAWKLKLIRSDRQADPIIEFQRPQWVTRPQLKPRLDWQVSRGPSKDRRTPQAQASQDAQIRRRTATTSQEKVEEADYVINEYYLRRIIG